MIRTALCPLVAVLLLALPAGAEERPYRVVNVVDDFVAYHEKALRAGEGRRQALWDEMLEARHPVFFRDAIYRRKEGDDLAAYKADCISRFWTEIAPRMKEIAERNKGIEAKIHAVVDRFKLQLPDFEPKTDFFVTISFSFRGKALSVGDREVLALGLEAFVEPGDLQFRITLAHELFHLYHFHYFPSGRGLYRSLWAEGMAVYASAVVIPGERMSRYLGFPAEKMNRCAELLPAMARDLKENLGSTEHRLNRVYFGAEDNDTSVPPEAGYYVGLLIASHLARHNTLKDLAHLSPEKVFPILEKELDRLGEAGD